MSDLQTPVTPEAETPLSVIAPYPTPRVLSPAEHIAIAQQYADQIPQMLAIIMRVTHEDDWVEMDGKPYLTASGCQKIALVLGVCWGSQTVTREEDEDPGGRYITYYVEMEVWFAHSPNARIVASGSCSTRDPFFGTKDGQRKPLMEIDLGNVRKKAVTNCLNRGIKARLGLNNLSQQQLAEAGLSKKSMPTVRHQTGKAGGTSKAKAKTGVTERIGRLLDLLCGDDRAAQMALYHEVGDFATKDGKRIAPPDLAKLSEKWAWRIAKELEKRCADEGIDPDAQAGGPPPEEAE